MRNITLISLVILLFIGSGTFQEEKNIENPIIDSLPITYREITQPTQVSLPDTIFESISAVQYSITIFDSVIDPLISNFEDPYLKDTGNVLTFRGNRFRNGDFGGRIEGTPTTIVQDWAFKTAYDTRQSNAGQWGGGTGWTGQPLLYDSVVICTSLCSKAYFLDWETGKMVSNPINVRNPIKGTAMLDPLYPHLLYVGHGVAAERPWGCMTFNIQTGQQIQFFKEDSKAWRRWGAYDSSPLRVDKFVFRPGENGTLYKWYIQNDTILLHSTLRYTCKGKAPGMEASMTVYKNYGYTADNHGNILCTNLNSLQPVWHYYNHDDTDASLVMEVDEDADSTPYLYSGCEVDYQGSNGFCYLIKLNAIDGSKVWERKIPCKKIPRGEKFTEGGIFATPLPGKGNCSDRLYICCITNTPAHHGDFMAIDKKTGEIIYSTHLDWYPWMSPISFLNENNEEFIVAGDTQGKLYLINGKTGEIIYKNKVGLNFESSPAVRGNSFVLGSRGTQIYKFHIE
jgi:outer membrane protein assembly factor BamB